MHIEQWRPVAEFPDHYEVSNTGRVRSRDRMIRSSRGGVQKLTGRVLKPGRINNSQGHRFVMLSVEGKKYQRLVHRLVLEAFEGRCPAGHEARHLDDNADNNHIDNLRWGPRSANLADRTRNGRRGGTRATETHCANGHSWIGNERFRKDGARVCAECNRVNALASYHRRKAREAGAAGTTKPDVVTGRPSYIVA